MSSLAPPLSMIKKTRCPYQNCQSFKTVCNGHYYRSSDQKTIQRYRCYHCGKRFSRATLSPAYRQKKRPLNKIIRHLRDLGISQRRMAALLGVNRRTVRRKIRFLNEQDILEQKQKRSDGREE